MTLHIHYLTWTIHQIYLSLIVKDTETDMQLLQKHYLMVKYQRKCEYMHSNDTLYLLIRAGAHVLRSVIHLKRGQLDMDLTTRDITRL